MSARLPRVVVLAWVIAAAGLAGVAAAAVHYVTSGSPMHMDGMGMGDMTTGDALTRGGSGGPHAPLWGSALVTAWQLDTIAVAVVVLLAAWYLTGVALVPVRNPGARWPVRHTLAFLGGLLVCVFATCGSIAVYDQALFSAHMAGHLALVMVAPALLMAGRPVTLALEVAPPARRARLTRLLHGPVVSVLMSPPVALATYTAVIVVSHLTGLMNTIMRNTWAGQLEHLVYLLAGCQFFALVVSDPPIRWRLSSPPRWLLLAVAMAVDTFTGIVLMQGSHAVALHASALDVNALSDTRTGGAIMWFGGDAIMALIMIWLVVGWLRTVETKAPERGWLEQARSATFEAHTAGSGDDLDEDDDARTAYNDWLAKLDRH